MSKMKILLVDDEADILTSMETAVSGEGYEVISTTDGWQALELARQQRPDLILLDVMMPGMDGYEVCKKIKQDPLTENISVVFLSARDITMSKVEGLDSGAYDYITKPFHYAELFARLRSFQREHEYRQKITAMMEFSRSINILEFDELVSRIEKNIKTIFQSDFFSIFLWDPESRKVRLIANNRHDFDDTVSMEIPIESTPIMEEVVSTGKIVYVRDFCKSRYQTEKRDKYRDDYALGIPLLMGDKLIGVLNLNGNSTGFFNTPDLTYMMLGSEHITSALSNSLQYRWIQEMAITDPLTGLFNRRYFFERLNMEWARSQRYKTKMSVMMSDIDFFKKVNDTYGHICGDMILTKTAQMMGKHLRKIDVIARYGGEEFILLLPETPKKDAAMVADRMRRDMESTVYEWEGQKFSVTISFGVEDTSGDGVATVDDIIRLVDEKLYKAKESGRNRVIV